MRLGLFCPGSPPRQELLQRGLAWLEERGFDLKLGETVAPGEGLHAGRPERRAKDLTNLLSDPRVDAVLCVRGGSGTMGMLPLLEYERLEDRQKPIIGLSDVTALHLALRRRCGWEGISAPMVVQLSSETPAYTEERWLGLVRGPYPEGEIPLPSGCELGTIRSSRGPDSAEGILLPCNLSLLVALVGTPYLPDLSGAILVLEDIHESPQSLDRMVCQLALSGAVDRLAGLVLGQFTECVPRGFGVTEEEGRRLVRQWAENLGVPALHGLPYGHDPLCCSLPFGAPARISRTPPELRLLPR